jgi:hypothetical protein
MRLLFRLGPIVLLVPLALWGWAWTNIVNGEDQSWYIVWPIVGVLILAALWHAALIAVEKRRRIPYLLYAIVHMPVFYVAANIALIIATRFPL